MDRTVRAALVAGLVGLVVVGGLGWLMGFDAGASVVAGLVTGLLFAGLLLAAARRSASMAHPDEDHLHDRGPH